LSPKQTKMKGSHSPVEVELVDVFKGSEKMKQETDYKSDSDAELLS